MRIADCRLLIADCGLLNSVALAVRPVQANRLMALTSS